MSRKMHFENESKKLVVRPSKLYGKVSISGAKNSALRLLAASLLTDEDIIIENFPTNLSDVKIHVEMLKVLGKNCEIKDNRIIIKSDYELKETLNWEGRSIRNTLLIFGALLARKGKACVPLPGGCSIGQRKYDLHQMLLEKLGARVWEENGYLFGEAPNGLVGTEIYLPIRSTGATENGIIAGSLAKGKTTLWNPHIRPEIIDLISCLRSMGVEIEVSGQQRIQINGKRYIGGTRHTVIPDNVEAITFLIAAVITHGDIELENFPYRHLEVPLIYLRESGAKFFCGENSLIVRGGNCYPIEISTGPYPGINSDNQPLFAVYGLCAQGKSKITDLRFPDRFGYAEELKKLGGNLQVKDNFLIINGGNPLHGSHVTALDLRCGAALVLTGLVAEGETIISNAEQIQRGYEDIELKMQILGGNIRFI